MKRIRVAILRGGPGHEHEVSLASGKNILENLSDKYIPTDIFVAKDGSWYLDGVVVTPSKLFKHIDVVVNVMHGEHGEDGKIQRVMDHFGVKYTGSKSLASALGRNKLLSKNVFIKNNLKTPVHKVIKKGEDLEGIEHVIFRTFPMPAIIKPSNGSLSMGVSLVRTLKEIMPGIMKALEHSDTVIVEEFINGKEATCGVIENFRGESVYPLMPAQIVKSIVKDFLDHESKKSKILKQICPGNFDEKEKRVIQEMAKNAHKALGLRHYSKMDFIVSPKRGVYLLEANTLPGLTKKSLFSQSLEAVGFNMPSFLDHVITLALES